MTKMLNNYLLCREVKEEKTGNVSGFETPDNEKRFKGLDVTESSEADIPKGSRVTVSINAGEIHVIKDIVYTVIRRGDVVWID